MPRLRRANPTSPGLSRRRRGAGFSYVGADGRPLQDTNEIERIRALAIPPAWQDVWICADPQGHLQALGTDAAGRRQYLYHPAWRERRDREKFNHMLEFARALPHVRAQVSARLQEDGPTEARVLAAAIRLLDRGLFRVGGEAYAAENGTYGLATLEKRHVAVNGNGSVIFDYIGKAGKRHVQEIVDSDIHRIALELKRRRSPATSSFLAYRERRWIPVDSEQINAALKELAGAEFSAKDFRTWHATTLAAAQLAAADPVRSDSARRRVVKAVVEDVARQLGNTPAVCRASYIDARVFDRYRAGDTIAPAILRASRRTRDTEAAQAKLERAVVRLLS